MKLPSHIATLSPYVPGKPIEELERELGITGCVKLASNENPLGPSPKAMEAVRAALGDLNRYPDGGGYALRKAIAARFQWPIDGVILGNGSVDLIEIAVRTFCASRDEMVIPQGAFISARLAAQSVDAALTTVPMKDYRHDADAIAARITPRTRAVYVDNPSNPLGTFIRRDEWARLVAAIPDDCLLIADQAYFEFIGDPDYPDAFHDLQAGRNVLVLRTFSKIHGLAGLRIGYGLADPKIVHDMHRVRSPFNTNLLAQAAGIAALEDQEHLEAVKALNAREMAYLEAELDRRKIKRVPSVTNFILVNVERDAGAVYDRLLREGVIVRPLKNYGLSQHLRISIGTHEENERLLQALDKVL
jgi:histidinol-phosphate aminotransferase